MSIFDDILALLTPERLLRDPKATGEGVRLCVIDSGMDRATLEEKYRGLGQEIAPITGGIFTTGSGEPWPYEGKQSTPHGTTVADIILSIAPRVQLFSADVLGPQGSCEVEVLIKALRWAVDVWKVNIVNLSLGVAEQRLQQLPRRQQFLRAIEDAYFKDVLIVAAAHNDHPLSRSYPSLFAPPLVSVDKHLFADPMRFAYQLHDQIEFQHRPGLSGPVLSGTSDKLGRSAPGGDRGPYSVAQAGFEAV